jgi:hypothetical protein
MGYKEFLKSKKFLWILIILNLINAVYSTFIFLVFLQVPVYYWIFLNICAPIQFFTIAGLLLGNRKVTSVAVPLLIFFGFGGLFVFSWSGYMIQAQLNHILMTITAVYIFWMNLEDKRTLAIGVSLGVVVVLMLTLFALPMVMHIPEVKEIFEQMIV